MLTKEQIKSIKEPGTILPNGIFVPRGAKMRNHFLENRKSIRHKEARNSNNRKGLKRVIISGIHKITRLKQFIGKKLIVHYL